MAQQVELPTAKAVNMSLIPRAYMVKIKVLQLFSDLQICTVACTSHLHACRHTRVNQLCVGSCQYVTARNKHDKAISAHVKLPVADDTQTAEKAGYKGQHGHSRQ